VATTAETHTIRRAAALALFASAFVLPGCPTSRELLDTQEDMRDEIEMLRARLERLEADIARESGKIKGLSDRDENQERESGEWAGEREAPRDAAEEPAPADGEGAGRADADGEEEEKVEPGPLAAHGVPADDFTRNVQTALKRAGYEPGPVDGKAGAMTKRAIREFQKDSNLPETGVADRATWDLLRRYLE
jgi:hypothetical protein